MLNFYFWYSIITTICLSMYCLPFSNLNKKIDIVLLILMIASIIFSIIMGIIFNDKFKFKEYELNNFKFDFKPIIVIVIMSILEFIMVGDIPLISVTINQANEYQEFETIPGYHMLLSMISFYYSIKYAYLSVSKYKNKNKCLLSFIIINFIILLFNMRSFFMISVFIYINLLIAKLSKDGKIKVRNILLAIFVFIFLLWGFGIYGNKRQGFEWNDNKYIEALGLYYYWPSKIPKQYMWSYSYITSPIANLNYNTTNKFSSFNMAGLIFQFIPDSISKRIPYYKNKNICVVQKKYFNVSTGFCDSYSNGGYLGLIIFWIIIMFFPLIIINKYSDKPEKTNEYIIWLSAYNACISFLFFSNMFNYGGTAPALWLSTYLLLRKFKFVMKSR